MFDETINCLYLYGVGSILLLFDYMRVKLYAGLLPGHRITKMLISRWISHPYLAGVATTQLC